MLVIQSPEWGKMHQNGRYLCAIHYRASNTYQNSVAEDGLILSRKCPADSGHIFQSIYRLTSATVLGNADTGHP